MPCVFWSHPVMVVHSSSAMQLAMKFASKKNIDENAMKDDDNSVIQMADRHPLVFAEDFNIKPSDDAYALMTTGCLDKDR